MPRRNRSVKLTNVYFAPALTQVCNARNRGGVMDSRDWQEALAAVPMALLIIIILFRPYGLLGTPEGRAV